ncbi:hypothetical protein Nepgr_027625 [Nepenthes gracilis]|uniref:Uncharacterized protein n=1 Tax=Nepenthes gracilis TaxID=150966 RepID=A0AAD3Y1D4_NEPGR|nr:hypothetical protein Nepgr_027625 [Nepenthes gracilis]
MWRTCVKAQTPSGGLKKFRGFRLPVNGSTSLVLAVFSGAHAGLSAAATILTTTVIENGGEAKDGGD